ncbi:hypothetical protein DH2020_027398 [Rehmannia glutinosa]|uniref:Uncharacterized protein n=1 Tax=Rehmannia glutinosa TaxID=99300 RepID=A0ABR0VXV8_REHGL
MAALIQLLIATIVHPQPVVPPPPPVAGSRPNQGVTFREPDAAMRACVDATPVIDGRRVGYLDPSNESRSIRRSDRRLAPNILGSVSQKVQSGRRSVVKILQSGAKFDSQNRDDDGYENVIPYFQATDDHVEGRDTHRGTVSCGIGGTKGATVNIGRELISTTALHDISNIAVTRKGTSLLLNMVVVLGIWWLKWLKQ